MRTKWYLLGCLSSIIILIIIIVLSISSLVKLSTKQMESKVADDSVLYLNLTGLYEEYSTITDRKFRFIPDTTHDIIQKINVAKTDARIKAIILEPMGIQADYSILNEIMHSLNDFKSSGKKVYGYINNASQRDIYLLSVADEIYMNPSASAGFILHGVGGSINFYKDMLEKIGIEMHVVKAGDYKAAGEPFTRNSMSPEFKKNISSVYDDIYVQLITDLSRNFDTQQSLLKNTIEQGNQLIINQELGIKLNIVDELVFFDTFLKKIKTNEKQLISYEKYRPIDPKSHFNKVAVIYAIGNITPNRPQLGENNINSKQFIKMLNKIDNDNSIKAVVIRINSGGGSALESEIIFNKIAQVKEKKPVVVSMGGIAASGGYYIGANANYIFADPYTITGSIGVFSMIPDLSKSANKIGIKSEQVGYGKYLSLFNIWGMYNKDIEKAFQLMVDNVYHEFKTRVSESRNIDYNDLEKIAQGQIWSAKKAREINLIDEIGSLSDAVNKAASIASISNYSLSFFPERKNFFEVLVEENFDYLFLKNMYSYKLYEYFSRPANNLMRMYEEIKTHPIQMRIDFELDK